MNSEELLSQPPSPTLPLAPPVEAVVSVPTHAELNEGEPDTELITTTPKAPAKLSPRNSPPAGAIYNPLTATCPGAPARPRRSNKKKKKGPSDPAESGDDDGDDVSPATTASSSESEDTRAGDTGAEIKETDDPDAPIEIRSVRISGVKRRLTFEVEYSQNRDETQWKVQLDALKNALNERHALFWPARI